MARAHRIGLVTVLVAAVYLLATFNVVPLPFLGEEVRRQILPLIPWWVLVAFGSYSLWSIGWGLLTLRECPDAYDELIGEISEAKNDLRAKGVTVD